MNKYEPLVEAALAHAAPLVWVDGNWVPSIDGSPWLTDIPAIGEHETPIKAPSRDELRRPSDILADTWPEVVLVTEAYARISGNPVDMDFVNATLSHEQEHREVIRHLGGSSLYGVTFLANEKAGVSGFILGTSAYDWQTTKIGYAVTAAYPQEPSPSDIYYVRQMGYEGVEEVGEVARRLSLPIPLSQR